MKLYAIHVVLKDLSIFAFYILLSNDFGEMDIYGSVWLSLVMMRGMIIINLLIQTILYFGLKRYFRFRSLFKKFMIGVILHTLTLLFWTVNMQNEEFQTPVILSLLFSGLFSGLLYVLLNTKYKGLSTNTTD